MENQDKVQNDGSKKVDSKTICILVLIGVILVGVIVGICIFCFGNKKEKQQETTTVNSKYDSNIILDKDDVNKSSETVENGQMSLEMKNVAISKDGINFNCYLCNAKENKFDIFITIQDYDTGAELFRSGVMPVGSRIEKMKFNKELEEGEYSTVITFHQLESDGETEHAKVSVAYTLNVTK